MVAELLISRCRAVSSFLEIIPSSHPLLFRGRPCLRSCEVVEVVHNLFTYSTKNLVSSVDYRNSKSRKDEQDNQEENKETRGDF